MHPVDKILSPTEVRFDAAPIVDVVAGGTFSALLSGIRRAAVLTHSQSLNN